jgi:hypothetical protein
LLRLRESLARRRDLDDERLFGRVVGGGHFAFPHELGRIRGFVVHEPRLCIRTGAANRPMACISARARLADLEDRGRESLNRCRQPCPTTFLPLSKFVRTPFTGGTQEHATSACGLDVPVTRPEWTASVRGA